MLSDILANALGQLIGEVFGETIEHKLDQRAMLRELNKAVERAEERFAREYREHDAELVDVLITQTRFADLPSVRAALRELLTRPFHPPAQSVAALRQSFADVLPERVERARVDAAVQAFLSYLGQEVLYIPQLRELYALAFQKTSADHSRATADHTAALLQSMQGLRDDVRQIAAAPPLAALPPGQARSAERARPWHNLPQRSYTQFVGRQAELEKLTQLLLPHPRSRHFVVTLDGIGGVGKSALAMELAYRYRDGYANVPEPERFAVIVWVSAKRTLLTASGIQQRQQTFNTLPDLYREIATVLEQPGILQADSIHRRGLVERALGAQRTLLIVDNLETVDDEELLTFLREIPDPTKVIVTTRHRIDIAYAIRLTGMPRDDALALMDVEAGRKGVELPAEAMEDLFRRTGGVPLAIVWSIGLMSMGHSVESVLRRLGSGHSDIARFCFAESMARLRGRDPERLLFALSLFERSVSRQMLGEVAGLGDDAIGRDDGLAELLQLSLADQKGDRFKLLPLTHAFALEELERRSELDKELRERWAGVLTKLAEPYGGFHWRWRDRRWLNKEGMHFEALARWAEQVARPDALIVVAPALMYYYDYTGQWPDALTIGAGALEYARLIGDSQSIVFIEHFMSWMLSHQGRASEAERYSTDALAIAAGMGDRLWHCSALQNHSQILRRSGMFDQALAYCQQSFQILAGVSDSREVYARADIQYEIGKIARDQANFSDAMIHFDAARTVFRVDDDNPVFNMEFAWGLLSNIGYVEQHTGDLNAAHQTYLRCLDSYRERVGKGDMVTLLNRIAAVEEQLGDDVNALAHAREALDWSRKLDMMQELEQAEAIMRRLDAAPS